MIQLYICLINVRKQILFQHNILRHNKLLMTLNDLIDFCYGGGGHEICHIFNYGGRRVRDMIENQIFLNSQEIKDVVAYLLVNC